MVLKILLLVVTLTLVSATHNFDGEEFLRSIVSMLESGELHEILNSDRDDDALLFEIQNLQGNSRIKRMADGFVSGLMGLLTSDKNEQWASVNFAKQISCYQGRSTNLFWAALYAHRKYNGYGCYCGGGFYEGTYLDATDECCKHHDQCYNQTQQKYGLEHGCHTYTTTYKVECCEDEKITKCTNTGPSAGRDLCECDQEMARCVAKRRARSTYKKSNLNNRSQCMATSSQTQIFSVWDIILTCKHAFNDREEFSQTVPSQGKCPAKKGGWFWKRR